MVMSAAAGRSSCRSSDDAHAARVGAKREGVAYHVRYHTCILLREVLLVSKIRFLSYPEYPSWSLVVLPERRKRGVDAQCL